MYFGISTLYVLTFSIGILLVRAGNDNYPTQGHNPKPCARQKYTVTYQKPICLPDCLGGFETLSEQNCEIEFKSLCPEFNRAECAWFNLTINNQVREVPTCHLRYKAKKRTWMEVWYTHQYGKWMDDKTWSKTDAWCYEMPILDIVEISRYVGNDEAFGQRGQADWPNNVIDATGERGLKWTIMNNTVPLPAPVINNTYGVCREYTDGDLCEQFDACGQYQQINKKMRDLCEIDIVDYFKTNYAKGFDDKAYPLPSTDEASMPVTVTNNLVGTCISARQDSDMGSIREACQVLYTRSTVYSPKDGDQFKCEFVYLEVNMYNLPQMLDKFEIRYAYWYAEDKDERNRISCTTKV